MSNFQSLDAQNPRAAGVLSNNFQLVERAISAIVANTDIKEVTDSEDLPHQQITET